MSSTDRPFASAWSQIPDGVQSVRQSDETLIKTIMGLLPASAGWIKIFGRSYRENCHRVGYVPQRESVDWDFPVSVMDVVLMGRYGRLRLAQRPGRADRDIARACLEKVKMLPFANRQIGNLSGGQLKLMLEDEIIKVNGNIETARRRRLHEGDIVEIEGIGSWQVAVEQCEA